MTHSHVHLSTSVIDDQSLPRNKHIVWCGCYQILIQRSSDVLFLTRFCQLPRHSLSVAVSQLEEFLHKMTISSSEFHRQIILSQKTGRIRASVLNI